MSGPEQETGPGREGSGETARTAAPAKPGPLRIAAPPPSVMRLSRKTLAAMGLVGGLTIAGALIYALQSPDRTPPENLYDAASRNRPEQVTSAPASYVDSQTAGLSSSGEAGGTVAGDQPHAPVSSTGSPGADSMADKRRTAAQQAHDRALQERDSARTSRLFLAGETADNRDPAASASSQPAVPVIAGMASTAPVPTPTRQQSFLEARESRAFESRARIVEPGAQHLLQAGSVIPAALITGIRSDLPGQITAQVTQNVYDSPTGRLLLIPQGSRLIGEYDSEVDAGQSRVLLAWDRLILPGGRSIQLDRLPGADAAGRSGLQDRTDHHWGHMFKAALISTLLGDGSELIANDDSDLVRALRYGTQDTVNQTGRQLVERQLAIAPTLTIRPGFTLRIIVTRDLVFEPQGGPQ